jgi:hypothetical protein
LALIADNIRLDEGLAAAIRADLNAYREALQIARTVANHPRGWRSVTLGPAVMDTSLAETQAARPVARLLQSDAAIRIHDGDVEGSLDSCRAILNVGRSIGDEPFLVSQLVRVAIGGTATRAARRVLGQGEPSDAALGRLQDAFLDEADQPLLLYAVRGERASLVEAIRRVESGEISLLEVTGGPKGSASAMLNVAVSLARLVSGNQRSIALEWMNEAVAIARRPTAERTALWRHWEGQISAVVRTRFGRITAMLPLMVVPGMSSASAACQRYQADLSATAILIAAERHRRKTGQWPGSIAAIDRSILPNAPLDPFTGAPFKFEYHDGQLLIYSVGPNLEDNHGADEKKRGFQRGPDDVSARAWDVPLRAQKP